jgi:hypothetical protein
MGNYKDMSTISNFSSTLKKYKQFVCPSKGKSIHYIAINLLIKNMENGFVLIKLLIKYLILLEYQNMVP